MTLGTLRKNCSKNIQILPKVIVPSSHVFLIKHFQVLFLSKKWNNFTIVLGSWNSFEACYFPPLSPALPPPPDTHTTEPFQHGFNIFHIQYIPTWFLGNSGVEDEENWHGKALGDKAASVIAEIKSRIQHKGDHGLGPQPVISDAPAITCSVKLSEPPNYTKGQKVSYC